MKLVILVLVGFSSIRLAHKNPLLAMLYALAALNCAANYVAIFQLAFQITERVYDLMKVIEVKCTGLPIIWAKRYLGMILKSLPVLVIRERRVKIASG